MSISYQNLLKKTVPPLSAALHKGQLGKIGILGGCLEYTGAPFYAGISAQRAGADLVTIMCSKEAGIPIKCYSPELIVYPVIQLAEESDSDEHINEIVSKNVVAVKNILSRIDSLVIGPGAGRNPAMMKTISSIIQYAVEINLPLVIDGDGLWVVTQEPQILERAQRVILTPNQMEFTRLWNSVMQEKKKPAELTPSSENHDFVKILASKFTGTTILQKGAVDHISDGKSVYTVSEEASLRRCGGQGDVVSGVMGVMNYWTGKCKENIEMSQGAAAACCTSFALRKAAHQAFLKEGRGMTALSVSNELVSIIDSDSVVCLNIKR